MTIVGTRDILPAKTLKLFPGRAGIVIHPPIETAGLGVADVPGLAERTREAIATAMPEALR